MDNSTNLTNVGDVMALASPYTTAEAVCIVLVAGTLSLVTIVGNILVMVSIKVNRHLQTVSNYFLFSLACADLIIGVLPMNLYTFYIVIGHWPFGPVLCDLWLMLDYVVSNASVMHLLIISFDRYFCVTKPLSYPVKRTPRMAGVMTTAAWVLPFILWAPAILLWQGERTVPNGECDIQFLSSPLTCGTAIAAFYLPILIMSIFYWQISQASKSRMKRVKKEGGQSQDAVASSLVQGKIVKPNNNNIPANEDGRDHSKMQKGEATGESVTGHCATAEEKESSNDSTSVSVVASNVKEEDAIKEDARASVSPAKAKGEHSKLTSIEVLTTPPAADDCTETTNTPVQIVGTNGQSGGEKQSVARKTVKMAKQPAKQETPPSRERKVARTTMAISLAFIITYMPYDVMALTHSFCASCISSTAWTIGYWLCYTNSTINPACYALCNATFRKTFKHLLMCKRKNIGATR